MKSIQITLLTAGLFLSSFTKAQETTISTGGDANGNGGSVAFSLGLVLYTSIKANNGSVNQGIQHAYEVLSVGNKESELSINISVFPNPITDILYLQITEYKNEKLLYQIFDLQGKKMIDGQIEGQQTQINTANLSTAGYVVNVVDQDNNKIKTFKIIKN